MKKMMIAICLLLAGMLVSAEVLTNARGDAIVLNDDFTWAFLTNQQPEPSKRIVILNKSKHFNTQKTSRRSPFNLSFDRENYTVRQSRRRNEFTMQSKDNTLFLQTIQEDEFVNIDLLLEAAKYNARDASERFELRETGDVLLNGMPGKYMIFNAFIENLNFTFYGFYFSGKDIGSIQISTWTFSPMFQKNKKELESMVSGIEFFPKVLPSK